VSIASLWVRYSPCSQFGMRVERICGKGNLSFEPKVKEWEQWMPRVVKWWIWNVAWCLRQLSCLYYTETYLPRVCTLGWLIKKITFSLWNFTAHQPSATQHQLLPHTPGSPSWLCSCLFIMPPPRRGALSGDRRPSSVCPSVCLSVWCCVHRL